MALTIKTERVSELEFGQMMIGHKGRYPLEVVGSIEYTDAKGIFYLPTVAEYTSDGTPEYVTGSLKGYENREQLLKCIGRCWDKAEKEREKERLKK